MKVLPDFRPTKVRERITLELDALRSPIDISVGKILYDKNPKEAKLHEKA